MKYLIGAICAIIITTTFVLLAHNDDMRYRIKDPVLQKTYCDNLFYIFGNCEMKTRYPYFDWGVNSVDDQQQEWDSTMFFGTSILIGLYDHPLPSKRYTEIVETYYGKAGYLLERK